MDFSNYWFKYQYLSDLFKNHPLNAIEMLIHSIRNDDYNLLPVFFLVPFNLLFGDGRLAYILAIANILALPSIITSSILNETINSHSSSKKSFALYLIPLLTVALLPQFWIPILRGEVGVAGIIVINLIFIIYIKQSIDKQSKFNLILMGFLMFFLILLRRWYAYWVVSFIIALIIERVIFLFPRYHFKIKNYLASAKNIIIIGSVFLILLFLIATPIAEKMLFTDYINIYSAYKSINPIISFYKYFGFIFVLFFVLGFLKLYLNKQHRNFALFLIVQLIITTLLFSQTQDLWSKHYYLLIPTIIIFITFLIIDIFKKLDTRIKKSIFLSLYIFILLINFSIVFIPEASDGLKKIDFLLPEYRYYPLVRNDLSEINNLLNKLDHNLLINKDDYVYVLSSSEIFNDEILRNACLDKGNPALCDKILVTNHVDKRDGFPLRLLYAKYVIIAYPIQYHLKPQDQRVIGIIADQIKNQSNIGTSYNKLPYRFSLDNNVEVYIYQKVQPLKKSDLNTLSELFLNYYPDNKNIFTIKHICGLILKTEIGDRFGDIRYTLCSWNSINENNILIHPGFNNSSKIVIKLNKDYYDLKMSFAFDNPEGIQKSCGDKYGEIYLNIFSDDKIIFQKYINHKQTMNYHLDLTGVDHLEIIVDKGKNGPDCDWFMLKDIELQ